MFTLFLMDEGRYTLSIWRTSGAIKACRSSTHCASSSRCSVGHICLGSGNRQGAVAVDKVVASIIGGHPSLYPWTVPVCQGNIAGVRYGWSWRGG